MKRVLLIIALMFMSMAAMGQSTYQKVDNKTFQQVKSSKSDSTSYKATGCYYITKKGEKFEIYTHKLSRGNNAGKTACYIKRVSKKTEKPYYQKIDVKPEELK